MIDAFVVDASMAVAGVRPAQIVARDHRLAQSNCRRSGAHRSVHLALEISNALLVLQRRRKLAPRERQIALGLPRALPTTVDHEAAALAFASLAELAANESLSVYDAAYLELAMRRALPLSCKDGPLRAAAARKGVPVEA